MGKTNKKVKKLAQKGGIRAKVQKQHAKRNQTHSKDRRRSVAAKGEVVPKPAKRKGASGSNGDDGTNAAAAKNKKKRLHKAKDELDSVAAENMDVDDFLNTFNDSGDEDDEGGDSGDESSDVERDNVWGDDEDSDSDDEDMPTAMDAEPEVGQSAKPGSAAKKGAKKKSETERHREELEQLKETDPEFYAFLQKNDQEVLAFGQDSDDDDEDEDNSKAEDMAEVDSSITDSSAGAKAKRGAATAASSSKRPVLTASLLQQIILRTHKGSNRALILLIKAFRTGVRLGDSKQENASSKFVIESSAVFNHLLVYCIGNLHRIFRRRLQGKDGQKQKGSEASKKEKAFLPAQCKPWNSMKTVITSFLRNAVALLSTVKEKDMKTFILQRMRHYVVYFKILPKVGRKFLKALIKAWIGSTKLEKDEEDLEELAASDAVRVQAFLRVRELVLAAPRYYMTDSLKGMYLAFVKRSKYTTELSIRKIEMARHCVVELFCIDPVDAYQFTFVYIRQLAIHLRSTLKATNLSSAVKNVYNWQFVHCLKLWTEVLCVSTLREQKIIGPGAAATSGAAGKSAPTTSLEPLLYPLVQVLLATANLMPSAQSFPLLLHCVEMLNKLALVMRQYVPVFPVLMQMLNSAFLVPQTAAQHKAAENGRGAQKPSKGNARALSTLNLKVTLRLSATAQTSRLVKDKVMTRVLELTREFFDIHRFDIAQPELTFLPIRELRKFMKTCKNVPWNRAVKALVQETDAHAKKIRAARAKLNFGPHDAAQCEGFMKQERERHLQKLLVKAGILSAKTGSEPPAAGTAGGGGAGGGRGAAASKNGPKSSAAAADSTDAALRAHAASVVADNAGKTTEKKSRATKTKKNKKAKGSAATSAEEVAEGDDVVKPFSMWSDEEEESEDDDDDDNDDAEEEEQQQQQEEEEEEQEQGNDGNDESDAEQ